MASRTYSAQKAGLTRAINSKDIGKIKAECRRAIAEWDSHEAPFRYGWPDDWSRWQRALDDHLPWNQQVHLRDL